MKTQFWQWNKVYFDVVINNLRKRKARKIIQLLMTF